MARSASATISCTPKAFILVNASVVSRILKRTLFTLSIASSFLLTEMTTLAAAETHDRDSESPEPSQAQETSPEAQTLSAGIRTKYRTKTTLRYLGPGDKAHGFAIDAAGNAYRHAEASNEEWVKTYLEDLPAGNTFWTPTGAEVDTVGDTSILANGRTVNMVDLKGGKNQVGYVRQRIDGLGDMVLFCVVFADTSRWGEDCQSFRGLRSGQIAIARQSGDVYFNNDQGLFRSDPYNSPSSRVRVGGPAGRIYAGANTVYATDKITGDIYKLDRDVWVKISGPADDFAVSIDGSLFKTSSATVYQYFGGSRGWRDIGSVWVSGKLKLAVGNSSDVYVYDNDGGKIFRYSGYPNEWDEFYGPLARDVVASENELLFRTGKSAAVGSSLVSITHPREIRDVGGVPLDGSIPAPLSGPFGLVVLGLGFVGTISRRRFWNVANR